MQAGFSMKESPIYAIGDGTTLMPFSFSFKSPIRIISPGTYSNRSVFVVTSDNNLYGFLDSRISTDLSGLEKKLGLTTTPKLIANDIIYVTNSLQKLAMIDINNKVQVITSDSSYLLNGKYSFISLDISNNLTGVYLDGLGVDAYSKYQQCLKDENVKEIYNGSGSSWKCVAFSKESLFVTHDENIMGVISYKNIRAVAVSGGSTQRVSAITEDGRLLSCKGKEKFIVQEVPNGTGEKLVDITDAVDGNGVVLTDKGNLYYFSETGVNTSVKIASNVYSLGTLASVNSYTDVVSTIVSSGGGGTVLGFPKDFKNGSKVFVRVYKGIKIGDSFSWSESVTSNVGNVYENELPSRSSFLNTFNDSYRVESEIGLRWSQAVDTDGDKLSYEIKFYNGKSWINVGTFDGTSHVFKIPKVDDTTQAKFSIEVSDGRDKSGSFQSNAFSIFNNTPPSNPSAFITPTSGQVVKPLQTVKVNWGNSVDKDEDDTITYELSFFDGSKWSILGFNLTNTTFNHLIPKIRGTKVAKYKVRAYDSKDYSEYTESNVFEILDVDLSTLATPNALKLDGKDDKISLGANPCTSFSKQLTIGFNKIKLEKSDSEYPVITKMCGEGKPSYALYVTPEGHLRLSYSHTNKNNESVETKIDCTGKWGIVEAYIDTVNKTMGIKLDGVVVASKDIPVGDIIVPSNESTYIGFDFTTQKYGKFLVSGIGLFNKNLSEEESKAFREVEPTGKEEGLVVCYPLKEGGDGAILNDISPSKNGATMFGGIEWGFQFSVVTDIKTPYPYLPQTAENLDYLRFKIDEFRHSNGLTPINWTDSIIKEDITPIKALHWNEARKAIVEVYDKMGQKFANKITEEELRSTIQPHSTKYEIRNLPNVIDGIILGLKNK